MSSHSFRPLSQLLDSNSTYSTNGTNDQPLLSSSPSNDALRSHRDSFLLQRQADSFGESLIFGTDIETSTQTAYGTIYISAEEPESEEVDVNNDNNNGNNNNGNNKNDNNDNNVDDDNKKDGNNDKNNDKNDKGTLPSRNLSYGRVPLVIVSCGSYLKNNALEVEGIFRLGGSNKRIRQLQQIFSKPPDYGAKLDWSGYSVHDAASLLRRYLSSLSEPLIPFHLYDDFRNPLVEKVELLQYFKDKEKDVKRNKSERKIISSQRKQLLKEYSLLFQRLPPIQKRVLFYLLDMLAMFNLNSEKNRMPAKNLAAIFQPSILFHPDHDLSPEEYQINSLVIESMITYSHKILINVQNEQIQRNKYLSEIRRKNAIDTSNKLQSLPPNIEILDDRGSFDEIEENSSSTVDENTYIHNKPNRNRVNNSPSKSSPLKHMITSLDKKNDLLFLDELEPPPSPFLAPKKPTGRLKSKSLSIHPQSEVVRVVKTSESIEDILSRVTSNQSVLSSSPSSRMSTYTAPENIDNLVSSADEKLAEVLGIPLQPLTESPSKNNSESPSLPMTASTILDFPPVTPTEDAFKIETDGRPQVIMATSTGATSSTTDSSFQPSFPDDSKTSLHSENKLIHISTASSSSGSVGEIPKPQIIRRASPRNHPRGSRNSNLFSSFTSPKLSLSRSKNEGSVSSSDESPTKEKRWYNKLKTRSAKR